jgi:hypothetical protein
LLIISILNLVDSFGLLNFSLYAALLFDGQCLVLVLETLDLLNVLVLDVLVEAVLSRRMTSTSHQLLVLRRHVPVLRWRIGLHKIVTLHGCCVYLRKFTRG